MSSINFLWGCDPSFQFEVSWILSLLADKNIAHFDLYTNLQPLPSQSKGLPTVLCESGIHTIDKTISQNSVDNILFSRKRRLQYALNAFDKLLLFHLSDEEGNDGDQLYDSIPSDVQIFRNFYHSRYSSEFSNVHTFPIGPRDIFLDIASDSIIRSSMREYPWAFMGTLWPSGSRKFAVSQFLAHLPTGFYFGGKHFGQGLPLTQYKSNLMNSVFSLTPEGDRHLDTFRLWESLSCGCIPLLQDYNNLAEFLLPYESPIPIFNSWKNALFFAKSMLAKPLELDHLQVLVKNWWDKYKSTISNDVSSYLS